MFNDITSALRPAAILTLLFAGLLGIAYPAAITGVAQLALPFQANGSLVRDGERVIGSALIGQAFARADYFHARPSAAGGGYDASASSGSNLGPTSRALADRIRDDMSANHHSPAGSVPADLVTASASGLDPHISPEAALFQAPRIAAARRIEPAAVRALVGSATERPLLGFIGESRVNVLALNQALDRLAAARER